MNRSLPQNGISPGIEAFFDGLARCRRVIAAHLPIGDAGLDADSPLYARSTYEDLVALREMLPPPAAVLDLGCGKGHVSALLAEMGYQAIGLDIPETPGEQLEIDAPFWQAPVWRGFQEQWDTAYGYYNGTAIPLRDGSLDGVVCYAVLEHVSDDDRRPLIKEIARVLRPGGCLLVTKCPRRWAPAEHLAAALGLPHHDRLVSRSELRTWLEEAGLPVTDMTRTDLIPAFPPAPLRGWWDRLAPLLLRLERLLRLTPAVLLAHHTRAIAHKPRGGE
jgi:SAM-dependent methyltransferase